jgi:hypothetical protein
MKSIAILLFFFNSFLVAVFSLFEIIHNLLLVVKLFPEGTYYDTNCWITERGFESVIEK